MPVAAVFLFLFAAVGAAMLAAQRLLEERRKRQVNELLSTVSRAEPAAAPLLKEPGGGAGGRVERVLAAGRRSVEDQIRQAGLEWTPERLAGLTALAGGAGALAGLAAPVGLPPLARAALLAAVLGALPLLSQRRARK